MRRKNSRNVLLITVDCLRVDRLGAFGYPMNVTPNIDRLASEGLLFTQAYSVAPWTTPSFVSILRSTYPLMFGGDLSTNTNRTSIVEVLKQAGYETFGLTYHPYLSKAFGFGKGFDIYKDGTETFRRNYTKHQLFDRMVFMLKSFLTRLFDRLFDLDIPLAWGILRSKGSFVDAIQTTDEAIRLISDLAKQPFFLWIHYLDPHWVDVPHQIPEGFDRISFTLLSLRRQRALKTRSLLGNKDIRDLIKIYDSEIASVDYAIGRLLCSLSDLGLLDNTHIIVTSDHGEHFQEHGDLHHGCYLYNELIHIPLIIKTPYSKAMVVDHPVSLIDLSPTILDLVGVKRPSNFLGKSLMSLLRKKEDVSLVFSEEGQTRHLKTEIDWKRGVIRLNLNAKQFCNVSNGWKYIYTDLHKHELYNLTRDPFEKRNLIDDEQIVARNMREAITKHIQFINSFRETERQRVRKRVMKHKMLARHRKGKYLMISDNR